jgi:hypothetical protein
MRNVEMGRLTPEKLVEIVLLILDLVNLFAETIPVNLVNPM